ncbi:glutaredoxin domain-containing protein [Thamnocephalis sphaerospora]|uniref:Glutaredoxin domain-containing protein n=1 Tax=Thamnocephalis sphaerospora TaxID=78915 RepID=A0A4P9XMQ3_9FUNG|nr:glutaredoxin domain-containing protein [Thamnocephalis sphaerospora]|eukprot:RKP07175.1 glutaredoxin domain-containing protein [Thamnocephalis sphaerospora]
MATIVKLVQQLIRENKIIIFSKSYCPYCTRAKSYFNARNQAFFALELDQEGNGGEIQAALEKMTGQRTVPNIFIRGNHVGGYSDLSRLRADEVDALLSGPNL